MIYAIIIIAALAAAFVILIRRLPEAVNQSAPRPEKKPGEKKGFQFNLPKVTMPQVKLPELPAKPTQTVREEPVKSTPPTQAPKPATTSGFSMPKFSLPKWPTKRAAPTVPPVVSVPPTPTIATPPAPSLGTTKDDFWGGLQKTEPVSEPVTVATPPKPIAPQPVTKEKLRGKDIAQEAEDLFAIKDYRKAEKLYLRLAAEDPKNPKIYSRLGVIYMEQANYEDARDALQQAIKLEPNVASRHFNLALAYANLGSRAKAITSMELALKYDPSNRKYRKMLDELMANR
jgi:hypothetical protein